jgi:hypothetical protein
MALAALRCSSRVSSAPAALADAAACGIVVAENLFRKRHDPSGVLFGQNGGQEALPRITFHKDAASAQNLCDAKAVRCPI